jgi:aminoglycoside/choline kinase family phosphotransferase
MTKRDATIEAFLQVNGQGRALRKQLAGDASARRYERVVGEGETAILMDAPPDQPALRTGPFVQIASWLRQHGFSAPDIIDRRIDDGLVLMEDLGDDLFSRVLAKGGHGVNEAMLYGAAVDVLVALQALDPPSDLPPYDDDKMLEEVSRFTRWSATSVSKREKGAYLDIWRELLPGMRVGPAAFVYVDYHADNLLWLPEREGLARVGLLDFQDGRLGPCAYDLVSLLEDARRDVKPEVADLMIERYLAARPDLEAEAFRTAYAVLGAHRNSKILGMIANWARTGKHQYLALECRVRAHLERDLAHPRLATLAAWFDRNFSLKIAS